MSSPTINRPIHAPRPYTISKIALRPTLRSGSTLSLANAAPIGYSVNCNTPNAHEKATSAQNGNCHHPHMGTAKAISLIALLRPQSTRSAEHTSELTSLMRISYAVSYLNNTYTHP